MSDTLSEGGITSPEAAAAALSAAVLADGGAAATGDPGPGAAPATQPAPENQPPAAPQVDAGTTEESDSLLRSADIDLSGVTPEQRLWLEAREKEMQAVMTKRTQEASDIAKQFEGIDDPATAREALAFYEGVRTDPNYAAEVYDFLTANLMAAGYSPAKAAAAALNAVETVEEPATTLAPAFEDDPDAAVAYRLEQLDKRQQEIDQRFDAMNAREREQVLINEILKQDNAIRDAKGYTDEQMEYVYAFAESTQGDLFKAEELYSKLQEDAVRSYVAKKETTDDPAPPASAPATVPTHFPNLDAAHVAALERLRTELAQGG